MKKNAALPLRDLESPLHGTTLRFCNRVLREAPPDRWTHLLRSTSFGTRACESSLEMFHWTGALNSIIRAFPPSAPPRPGGGPRGGFGAGLAPAFLARALVEGDDEGIAFVVPVHDEGFAV